MPYFSAIEDPRRETKNKRHSLHNILMIVLCSVLSGVDDWTNMELFAIEKQDWFSGFIDLEQGIPSHDTLSNVMSRIHPTAFENAFMAWMQSNVPTLKNSHIAIDGKTLRGSKDKGCSTHLLTAYASDFNLVMAQQSIGDKTNEISEIPNLLSMLALEGCTVTLDAMGCQKKIAEVITKGKADFVLALKGNQANLFEDVKLWLDSQHEKQRIETHTTIDKDHGRVETRVYGISTQIDWLPKKADWLGLKAVGFVESTREIKGVQSKERRYYLTSLTDVTQFAHCVRSHWAIENSQHWVLDVQFGEDANRTRKDHSAKNLALIRRMALNILRQFPDKKSLKSRQMKAILNDKYRKSLIFNAIQT